MPTCGVVGPFVTVAEAAETSFRRALDTPAQASKLALLRLDAERAEIWENASSVVAGIKTLFGADPKQDYRDKVAKVRLR